jgi:CTP:phosphocholine cytidylyltransferase-like protein
MRPARVNEISYISHSKQYIKDCFGDVKLCFNEIFGVKNAVMIYFGVKQCLNEIFCLSNTLMR